MKQKYLKKAAALCMAGTLVLGLASVGGEGSITASASDDLTTITLYPRDANLTSGVVSGYMGDYLASLGLEVEVWAYSDEKTNAILASGDLPDIMYVSTDNLDTMIQAGMLLNLDDYLDQMPHVQSYDGMETALNYVREYRSNGTGSVYALPLVVGESSTAYELADSTDRNAVKLRWETYEAIGAPEITNMDDLLDVMAQMLEAEPTAEDGTTMYGTVLNSGSDTDYWACMTIWYRYQGYSESELAYLLESNMVDGTVSSILSTDSLYYQGLKWYNEAYNLGLVDPDSLNNDRATQKPKVDNGYAMVPSGYLPGWASTYLPYLVDDTTIYYNSNSPYGDQNHVIAINANTENIEACLAFLDMLADPDAYLVSRSGPEGEFWYVDENGDAYFTEEGLAYLEENMVGSTGFTTSTGESVALWNTPFIVSNGYPTSYGDGEGGYRLPLVTAWTEYNELIAENEIYQQWIETTGYESWQDWLAAEDAYVSESDLDYISNFESIPDDLTQLTIDAIRDVVVNASWQMVYASSDEEFDAIWEQMVSDCEGLGAEDIIEWRLEDIENAKAIRDSLAE
ncbi:MAG: extracellular solute-binding protein [Lachnospiraceae bacterium]|nr:extracellular solute-binding protein [Lachnospiraceae bacterium]